MSGTGASLNDKIDLTPWGNAPGAYFFHCGDCTKIDPRDDLHFGDQHNTRCIRHALEARQNEIRIFEGNLDPIESVEVMARVPRDRGIQQAFIVSLILAPVSVIALLFWL